MTIPIRDVQTMSDVPMYGATTREPAISSTMTHVPQENDATDRLRPLTVGGGVGSGLGGEKFFPAFSVFSVLFFCDNADTSHKDSPHHKG